MLRTTQSLMRDANISYRQLDHWVRQGYLKPQQEGRTFNRWWTVAEAEVAVRMSRLVRVGFRPQKASQLARETPGEVSLGAGVSVRVD